ncbi:hypothetical protein CC85DRAFT_129792 [Cutaneotrichosporon oleaginosum]|uniref:Uncharacterized protein n=1 Tax=Cutaneotrichosporon oleaginosum TaxID=879819 RepID=A0A0J1B0C2_9TREE|nr:uncharacterized protein CC85DRAFT_129792 [Cutaneotrichosporon oleaginosum]KLT41039.1 hypothetical protein CC85DRAFT_129792 [Cutaneotrichosporon oleaginosum]TXT12131.1 hypothetical protein COLE_02541 [Cutaneotrichosporon oleaginosum]
MRIRISTDPPSLIISLSICLSIDLSSNRIHVFSHKPLHIAPRRPEPSATPHTLRRTPMPQFTFFSSPAPPSPPPSAKSRRFSLQLHNPLPPYYARRKRPMSEYKPEPDSHMKSHQLKAQGEMLKTKQAKLAAQVPPVSPPLWHRPLPRVPRALPIPPAEDRCRCSICKRAEGEYTATPELRSHTASQGTQNESDRLSRLSLTSDESHISR